MHSRSGGSDRSCAQGKCTEECKALKRRHDPALHVCLTQAAGTGVVEIRATPRSLEGTAFHLCLSNVVKSNTKSSSVVFKLLLKCSTTTGQRQCCTTRVTLLTLSDGAAHQTVFFFSVAGYSDSEIILAALQTTVETVVRTQRHRLDADKFPVFSGWLDLARILS